MGFNKLKKIITQLSKLVYLYLINILSKPSIKKENYIIFLLSFPSTSDYLLENLYKKYGERLIVCYTKSGSKLAKDFQKKGCNIYCIDKPLMICQAVLKMKRSRIILCDNYFALLAGFNFDKDTRIVQLWHANGAIKKFGLQAQYAKKASFKDQQRYQKVYDTFTHFVVSSPTMAEIFAESYNIDPIFLKFGYPMTDYYFNRNEKNILKKKNVLSKGTNKKIALYVPTYRENDYELPLDFEQIEEQIGDEWVFYIHAHPHDKNLKSLAKKYPSYFIDEMQHDLRNLLIVADCLITDYSSVPFEFSLANPNGRIIYFCYDLQLYKSSVGLQSGFEEWASPMVKDQNELLKEIKNDRKTNFNSFNHKWNSFVSGNAVSQLIDWIDKQYEN